MPEVRDAFACTGGPEARQKVLEFLTKVAEGLETEGELQVTLAQVAKGGAMDVTEEIYDFSDTLDKFVEDLIDAAERDAMDIGKGRIKYSIRVAGKNARCTFALKVPEREDEDVEDLDELPNKKGLIAQQMQHNEVFAKLVVSQTRDSVDVLREMLREVRAENLQLKRREAEAIKMLEELRSMQFARDLEVMKIHKSEQRKDQVAGILMQGAPILISKLMSGGGPLAGAMGQGSSPPAGASATPPPSTPGKAPRTELELMLEGFLKTFTQEQLIQIANSGLLSPMQFGAFREILMYVLARDEAEKAAEAKANGASHQESVPA